MQLLGRVGVLTNGGFAGWAMCLALGKWCISPGAWIFLTYAVLWHNYC